MGVLSGQTQFEGHDVGCLCDALANGLVVLNFGSLQVRWMSNVLASARNAA